MILSFTRKRNCSETKGIARYFEIFQSAWWEEALLQMLCKSQKPLILLGREKEKVLLPGVCSEEL